MADIVGLLGTRTRVIPVTRVRFDVLDSWRGICALLVTLFHFPAVGLLASNGFIRGSYLFVDFFFVLSGFVIAHAYGERLSDGTSLRRFLVTRFGRLFPLHLFMLLAFVAFELVRLIVPSLSAGGGAFTGGTSLSSLWSNLFLVHGLGIADSLSWNAPSWSISTELFAYLLFGLVTLALNRTALLAFASAVIVAPMFLYAVSSDYMDATFDFGFIRCLYGFSFGVLIHAAFVRYAEMPAPDGETKLAWTFAEGATVAAVVLFVTTSHASAMSLAAPLIFGFAVFIFAHEAGYLSRVLGVRMFLMLGALSYSIYMTHLFVQGRMVTVAKLAEKLLGMSFLTERGDGSIAFMAQSAFPAAIVMIALVVTASMLTYRFIEVPGREWFRQLAKKIR
ncbi:MAG: acyltransferase [Rhizobiaceae bacterium]